MKKKFYTFIIFIFLLIIVSALFSFYLLLPLDKDDNARHYTLKVPQGASVKSCAFKLKNEKIIKSAHAMFLLAKIQKPLVKSGRYNLTSAMSLPQILQILQSGKQEAE